MQKNALYIILVSCLLLGPLPEGVAQQEFVPQKYWVSFTDKLDSPYSLEQPEAFLSMRAIARRISQGIPLNEKDLPVNPRYVDVVVEDSAVQVFFSSRWLNGILIQTARPESVDRIRMLPFVSQVTYVKPEAGGFHKKVYPYPPSDSCDGFFPVASLGKIPGAGRRDAGISSPDLSFSYPEYGLSKNQIEMVNGQALHKDGYWGDGKLIAVLDAGYVMVDQLQGLDHLWQNGQIAGFQDYVNPQDPFFTGHSHGTRVLSVMATILPEMKGTAPLADYLLVQTEDPVSEFVIEEYTWLAGAEYADSAGADIINSSLGYTSFDDPSQSHAYQDLDGLTTVVAQAANMAYERGMLVVNSAGNYGAAGWKYIGSPADSYGALSVGAVDSLGIRVPFSSQGPTADGRIKPEVMAQGRMVVVEDIDGGLARISGTSFAAPIIAGMAACLWQKHPEMTVEMIRKAIIQSASRYLHPDTLNGYGIPDFALADRLLKNDFDPAEEPLVLFPNPFHQHSVLSFYSDSDQWVRLDIFDATGKLLFSREGIGVRAGYNNLVPFRGLELMAQGMYLIRISYQDPEATPQVLKAIRAW